MQRSSESVGALAAALAKAQAEANPEKSLDHRLPVPPEWTAGPSATREKLLR
jgi:hypothetical protein